jgi:UDP-glucuronate 4-epimerase
MTTLITGGAGFVGSHVAAKLLERGERVVAVDNFNDYYDPQLKRANAERLGRHERATVIEADIRDAAAMRRIVESHGVARIGHMAAMAGVRMSVAQPLLYLQVNVEGTTSLLEAARHCGVENFVLASTSSVYGRTQRLPFVEDDNADRPLAPYPATKRAAELLAHSYAHLFGLNVTALRFFNVYGPAGRPDMMPMRLMHSVTRGDAIPIYNSGDIHRDWTYIDDTVDGVVAALDRPLGYEVINLGFGRPVSLNAFIDEIERLSGRRVNRIDQPAPASDPPITYCNNERARRLLDFRPEIPVEEGLARTWDWFQENVLST